MQGQPHTCVLCNFYVVGNLATCTGTLLIQRISLCPRNGLGNAARYRRAREKCREGQRGGFHPVKDPRNALEIF